MQIFQCIVIVLILRNRLRHYLHQENEQQPNRRPDLDKIHNLTAELTHNKIHNNHPADLHVEEALQKIESLINHVK